MIEAKSFCFSSASLIEAKCVAAHWFVDEIRSKQNIGMNFKVCTSSSLRFGEVSLRRNSKSFTLKTPLLLHLFPNFSKEVLELSGFDVSNLAILVPIAEVFKLQEAADKMKVEISRIIGFDGEF